MAPPSGSVVGGDVAAMFFHDSIADTEPETGAFAYAFRGIEGIKDALWILDSRAVVSELRTNVSTHGKEIRILSLPARPVSRMASTELLMIFRNTCSI